MNSLEESSNTNTLNSSSPSLLIQNSQPHFLQLQQRTIFDFKTIVIIVLIILIILLGLGINVFNIFGDILQSIMNVITPFISKFLSSIGYSTGEAINVSAEFASDSIINGIELAEGAVKNVGDILIDASSNQGNSTTSLNSIEQEQRHLDEAVADSPENTIQKSITSSKQSWCLVGEYQNKRGCIPISESDKCLSGNVFPNQQMCLNPTFHQK